MGHEGTYLRQKIEQHELHKVRSRAHLALTYDGILRSHPPRMLNETAGQLVAHLAHPERLVAGHAAAAARSEAGSLGVPALNGWFGAQQPASLAFMRLTLEGLGCPLTRAALKDATRDADPGDSRQRVMAAGDRSFAPTGLAADPNRCVMRCNLNVLSARRPPPRQPWPAAWRAACSLSATGL